MTPLSDSRNDRSNPSSRTRESDCESVVPGSHISWKKPSFREVVLRATQHKSFREALDDKGKRRLSNLGHQARLERFRQVASRWKTKSMKQARAKETFRQTDFEIVIPEKPRFCATLSTEAQYATFKGYEDALVHKISSSFPSSEGTVPITRVPSAKAKSRTSNEKTASFVILENKPTIVLSSLKESKKYRSKSAEQYEREHDHNQRYMSAHFQQAMNLLDELERNSYTEAETKQGNVTKSGIAVMLEKNIEQYQTWTKQWTQHFKFCC